MPSGSIASMLVSLRNNTQLLRRKSMFKKESSFLNGRKKKLKASEGKIETYKATPEELYKTQLKLLKNKKLELKKWWIAIAISIPFLLALSYIVFKAVNEVAFAVYSFEKVKNETKAEKKHKTYYYYIANGDNYMKDEAWEKAIFQYQSASFLFPDEYDAKYRLCLAYSYNCTNNGLHCYKAKKLTATLLIDFPEDERLKNLSKLFSEITFSEQIQSAAAALQVE